MPNVFYRLKDPAVAYVTGDLSKQALKREIREVEQEVEGANWWSITTGLTCNIHGIENRAKLTAVLLELYDEDDVTRVVGGDVLSQAQERLSE